MQGSSIVPYILRGRPQRLFSVRVTVRITLRFVPEKVTFVIPLVQVTTAWVVLLRLPVMVWGRPRMTVRTV